MATTMKMMSGYCYEYEKLTVVGEVTGLMTSILGSSDEDWLTEVYEPNGTEEEVGRKQIDGSECVVFECADNKFRAQTLVAVGGGS